jgi:hypothetical protein
MKQLRRVTRVGSAPLQMLVEMLGLWNYSVTFTVS